MDNKKVEIFTDGACKGNPGPGGWGALLRYGNKEKEINGYNSSTTNNIMELTAVIEALKQIKKPYDINITTDSTYVKNGITDWIHNWNNYGWKTSARKSVKNKELWGELDSLIQVHKINWIWGKGHSGHPDNERADELANNAIIELA